MWDWTKERRSRARLSLPWWGQSCGLKGELRGCLHKAPRETAGSIALCSIPFMRLMN